jgi:hypothetical protein
MTTDQNKSPPINDILALAEKGYEVHLYKFEGLFECLITPPDVAKHQVGRGYTPVAAVTEAIAKVRRQQ